MSDFLPYGRQSIDQSDIDAVVETLRSDYLTTGPAVDRFERDLAKAVGAKEAVVVANGTAALHIAALTQNLSPQDAVIVPAITFAASANCAAYCGARVVFADVDPDTGLITDDAFDEALAAIGPEHRFAGVVPVHYAGRAVDLTHISSVCRDRDAFLVEDACHAIGTTGPQGAIGACEAIKYPELGRDSGLMALWFMAAMVGGVAWCIAAGISLAILRPKSRRSPVVRP